MFAAVFIPSVHAFDFFGVVVEVSALWVNPPIELIRHPNALTGVGVGYKERITCVALADGDWLVGVDVIVIFLALSWLMTLGYGAARREHEKRRHA